MISIIRRRLRPRFAILGAGHGGHALAGYLGLLGYPVRVYTHTPAKAEAINFAGGIWLEGAVEGFGHIERASLDLADVLDGADIILETHPAHLHRQVAVACRPLLREGQVVVLNPGRTGGALEFANVLEEGDVSGILLGEAQTFPFASRMVEPGRGRIFGIKRSVPLAALPARLTRRLLGQVHRAMPWFTPAANVLETSLANIGAVFHPTLTLLNAGRIEDTQGSFEFYHQGATPGVGRVLEQLDQERLEVAAALGTRVPSAQTWLGDAYGARGRDLRETILENESYAGIQAPSTLAHRYLDEDVPASLVPLASLGKHLGVLTPVMDGLINLASVIRGTDYRRQGRTVERLGLQGLGAREIQQLVMEGRASREAIS